MQNRRIVAMLLILMLALASHVALADGILRDWSGVIRFSIVEGAFPASLTFDADGGYRIDTRGVESTGTYAVEDGALHLTPGTPPDLGTVTLRMEQDGDTLHIWGTVLGIDGDLSMTRQ